MTSNSINRRLRSLAVAFFVLAATGFAFWPRGPRLEWYRTRDYTPNGRKALVEILVPEGWTRYEPPAEFVTPKDAASFFLIRIDAPDQQSGPLVEWVRKLLGQHGPRGGYIRICIWGNAVRSDQPGLDLAYCGALWIPPGLPRAEITYRNRDRREFEATYRRICESFRVVR